jgi:hypothetical protein
VPIAQSGRIAANYSDKQDDGDQGMSLELHFHAARTSPNENKMSDGWRESAWLRVEGEISSRTTNQSCQPFAPSHG